eukprot:gene28668-35567_t
MSCFRGVQPQADVDRMSYEQLLDRFQAPVRRVEETNISALPTRIYSKPAQSGSSSSSSSSQLIEIDASDPVIVDITSPLAKKKKSSSIEESHSPSGSSGSRGGGGGPDEQDKCCICMEEYSTGDEIKTLPCLHMYHSHCIESWLRQSRNCPVWCWSVTGERQTQKFRERYVNAILSQEIGWFDSCGAGELSTR